ncbi:hypothetical protein [Streptomyces sp. VRA16 Mangrove soil]|uniref:baeRF2 domain-containing protein n=1 Tax=Streptomyces sp. VRA16 Mangrove soil TaxID=2817434 RepID=UPI001A9CEECB|nr:hypothetical protein [Streptomyces sp. VRA16 Mangrove soil]MBO1331094.1 hypothetical protein [Streptomyces sp. VRA16 Mangrove soil]
MDLAFLTPLCERPGPWASVYVDASRLAGSTAEERSSEALGVQRALACSGADEATCHAVRMAVDELWHSPEPVGRAFFATGGEVVLDPPLSTAPPGTSARWAALPHTTPLLDLAGEEPLWLVADTGEPDAAEVAEALTRRQAETRAEFVVLVGDDKECAAVRDRLPAALRVRHGTGGLESFAAARGRGEGAAEGVPALVEAAREHRISELLVRAGGAEACRQVWVGSVPDQIGVRRADVLALGARDAFPGRADDALMLCAAASGAGALSLSGPPGALAALLHPPH